MLRPKRRLFEPLLKLLSVWFISRFRLKNADKLLLGRFPLAADRGNDFAGLLHGGHGLVDDLAVKAREFSDLAGVERFTGLAHGFEDDFLFFHFQLQKMIETSRTVTTLFPTASLRA